MSNSIGSQLLRLEERMKIAARRFARTSEGKPETSTAGKLPLPAAETLNLFATDLAEIINANGLAPAKTEPSGAQLALKAEDAERANQKVAEFLAMRLCDLLMKEAHDLGVPLICTLDGWEGQPAQTRQAFARAAEQLMTDAREERERWTREFIASELEILRASLSGARPEAGRFATLRDLGELDKPLYEEPTRIFRVGCEGDAWHGRLVSLVAEEDGGNGARVRLAGDYEARHGFRSYPRTALDEPEILEELKRAPSKALRLSVEDEEANQAVRFAGASAIPSGQAREEARDAVGTPKDWRPTKGGDS